MLLILLLSLFKIHTTLFLFAVSISLYAQNDWKLYVDQEQAQTFSSEQLLQNHLDSLLNSGFYTLSVDSVVLKEHFYYIQKGKNYKNFVIQLDSISQSKLEDLNGYQNDVEKIKTSLLKHLEREGYTFAKVSSTLSHDTVWIYTELNVQRRINGFVIESDEKYSKAFLYQLNRNYTGEIFNDSTLAEIDEDIQLNPYLGLKNPSKVLFLKDSTIIYTYPEKMKRSYFDGILGFTSDENGDLKITGNIDLQLGNAFNAFETLKIHWNSAANASQDFNLLMDFPFLGKTSLGSKTELKIFRQDSTFVNFDLKENLYYHINRRTQLGLLGFLQSSTYLNNDITNTYYEDFSKNGLGLSYQYLIPIHIALLEEKFRAYIQSQYINAYIENQAKSRQYLIASFLQYIAKISKKNYGVARFQYQNLLADSYVNNELFRTGGIYSIRGFNENSIIANQYYIGSLEYRYLPSEQMYFSVFWDFGKFENRLQNQNNFLMGIGTGLTFQTRFGLFSLQYALGKYPDAPFQFDASRIHIGIKTLF